MVRKIASYLDGKLLANNVVWQFFFSLRPRTISDVSVKGIIKTISLLSVENSAVSRELRVLHSH